MVGTCKNCRRETDATPLPECPSCKFHHCPDCSDVVTKRCFKCEGVTGAYGHQRLVAEAARQPTAVMTTFVRPAECTCWTLSADHHYPACAITRANRQEEN